jgi:hypothetical protein
LEQRGRNKDSPTARRILVENISKKMKKNKDYDDPKQVRMNKTNSTPPSKHRLLIITTHPLSQTLETT